MPLPSLSLERLLDLYAEQRYLDAYALTRELWSDPGVIDSLTPLELVFAGRLASRLGNEKVQRWLFRLAWAAAPDDPEVAYFAGGNRRLGCGILDRMRLFEERDAPEGRGWLRASWLASHAVMLASFRDFERAHERLARARETGVEHGWVDYCEAEVLMSEDRWPEGLACAQRAWATRPGHPAFASVLGRALTKLGRLAEAVEILLPHAETGQSYITAQIALWHLRTWAQRAPEQERLRAAGRAYNLAGRLGELAPLADREATTAVAVARADAALIMGDRQRFLAEQEKLRWPFFAAIADNLAEAEGSGWHLLPYQQEYQKHDTCLPASVAAVAPATGLTIDPAPIAEALTYGGTAVWRVRDWLHERGYGTVAFVVTPANARRMLHAGLPFVLITTTAGYGHATAAIGIDDATGTIIIHDPAAIPLDRVLLDGFHRLEAPLGPLGLAFTPSPADPRLRLLPAESREPAAAHLDYAKQKEEHGVKAAGVVVDAAMAKYPDHPLVRRLAGLHAIEMGQPHAAIRIHRALFNLHPKSVLAQADLVSALHATRDGGQIRQVLSRIVAHGFTPGFRPGESWRYVPATYLAQLADHTGITQKGYEKAERLLKRAILNEPFSVDAYHVLGDVLMRQGRKEEALLPLRLAATLATNNEHYARSVADTMRALGQTDEALEFLQARTGSLGHKLAGDQPWATLVQAAEDYGQPELAEASMRSAQAARRNDDALAAFAVRFWVDRGEWDAARIAVARLETGANRSLFLGAAVFLARAEGNWRDGLRWCEEWRAEAPNDLDARSAYLDLFAHARGNTAALSVAVEWMREYPGDSHIEQLWYAIAERLNRNDDIDAFLHTAVERNDGDVWAWLELGHRLAFATELQQSEAPSDELQTLAGKCQELAPDAASTLALTARLAALRGDRSKAVQALLDALARDPTMEWGYSTVWELNAELEPDQQREATEALQKRMLSDADAISLASSMALGIAARYGLQAAEAAIGRWQEERGEAPELVLARARLYLDHARGISDAETAARLLADALLRYPARLDLRVELTRAHGQAGREQEELETLREVVRRQPLNAAATAQLARAFHRQGDTAAAIETLEQLVEKRPIDAEAAVRLADLFTDLGRHEEAIHTFRAALTRMPEAVGLYERLVNALSLLGRHEEAVEVGRAAVEMYPNGALCWFLYGEALHASPAHPDPAERERAYRHALELNATLWRAADGLALLLAEHGRFDDAREVAARHGRLEPGASRARLAWIDRISGRTDEARQTMRAVIERFPDTHWAWAQWMTWVEEDQAWQEAHDVLDLVVPQMAVEPELAGHRLHLLELAGTEPSKLAEGWEHLLADFPTLEPLHLRRFDELWERGARQPAAAVLDRLQRRGANSAFVLARQVAVLVHRGEVDAALDLAAKIWRLPGDDEWPERMAWQTLQQGQLLTEAIARLGDLLLDGVRVRVAALQAALESAADLVTTDTIDSWLRRLAETAWESDLHLVALLDALTDRNETEMVAAFLRDGNACAARTPVWMAAGRALAVRGDILALREWALDWRERPQVEMWSLANYVAVLRASDNPHDHTEALGVARHALQHLSYDSSARFLATVLLEMGLRGRLPSEEVARYASMYRGLLTDDRDHHWAPKDYDWARPVMLLLAELAEGDSPVRDLNRRLIPLRPPRWVLGAWFHYARQRLTWLERLGLRLRLILGVSAS